MKVLGKLEETCEAVAAFWLMEAEAFDSQGGKMRVNQVAMLKGMKRVVVKDNLPFWKKAKDEMDRYITAMSVVNNCFNFLTDATPQAAQSIKFADLELDLHLPAAIDVKAITA